ncbi:ATP synthase subunit a [Dirofilaria immitis]
MHYLKRFAYIEIIFITCIFVSIHASIECPDGREMLIMGKYMPVLCSVENSIENDMCPEGYECLPSATTFMRHNGQSYNICCKAI